MHAVSAVKAALAGGIMKRPRPLVTTVLASVVAVLAITGLTLTGTAHATPARPTVSPVRTVVFDCPAQQALVRPKTFILTCADGNALLDTLSWSSWAPGLASAIGSLVLNDCTPYCAAGHFHSYPAVVVFWGSKAVKNHPGERCYTMMTEILTGPRPRYYDYATHKWVTAPVTQTTPLLTSPTVHSPGA
jgi:hypothetical protein